MRGAEGWQTLPSKVVGLALYRGDAIRVETACGGYRKSPKRDHGDIEADRGEGYAG